MSVTSSTLRDYRIAIEKLRFGKRAGTHVYVHSDAVKELPTSIRSLATLAAQLAQESEFFYTVLKFGLRAPSVSLLHYPGFWHHAFPLLSRSATVDFAERRLKVTDYRSRSNRPVLHRKELLLPSSHSHYEKFSAVTKRAEELGLFQDPQSIGLQKGWRKVLCEKRVSVRGHTLRLTCTNARPSGDRDIVTVARHRSAISRTHLSQPFQVLKRYGFLNGNYSVFDYGCGRGRDMTLLRDLSVEVSGWDPHFFPNNKRQTADIVNLGFVINVIEERSERDFVLTDSFSLASKMLVVSALIGSPDYATKTQAHGDGVITSLGTFQKYFLPDELENYVRDLLSVPVTSVAQGVVIAFQSEHEADRFRARRAGYRSRTIKGSRRKAAELYMFDEGARASLAKFWEKCTSLGREPLSSELNEEQSLSSFGLSTSVAYKFLRENMDEGDLAAAASQRREELLVQFALGFFDGRVYYKYLPEDVQKDIDEFFGSFSALRSEAKALLYSIADTEALRRAAYSAADEGLGYLLGERSLQVHVAAVDRLPGILRVYIGCAERLIGGLGRADLVKVHLASGKVSFLSHDDFDGQAIPFMTERIKVNLWHRTVHYFDYIGEFAPPPLLMKSLFLPEDSGAFERQAGFDARLVKLGLFDPQAPHPSRSEFEDKLRAKGVAIVGFDIVPS